MCPGTPEYEQAVALGQQDSSVAPLPLDQAPWCVTLFTSMFMHGGILHIAGNMLFLWVFGNNIEDSMGRVKFTALLPRWRGWSPSTRRRLSTPPRPCPRSAPAERSRACWGRTPCSIRRARVLTLIFIIFFVTLVEIPALILLAIWFVLQFLPAIGQVATPELGGGEGVAYFAHVGGFLFGLATIKLLARRRPDPEPPLPVY